MKELKSYIYVLIHMAAVLCVAFACTPQKIEVLMSDKVISVGGVDRGDMTIATKAVGQDADKVDWLVHPLESGLDIVYGLDGYDDPVAAHQDVAILKLTDPTTEPATYSFKYREDRTETVGASNQAIWYNNGFHYFQGVYVPGRIRYTSNVEEVEDPLKAPGLTSDQHDGTAGSEEASLGNYTLLSHYLGMPASFKLTATIERIKLPFRHRLARVVAFVLIDPELNTTLKGYNPVEGVDDPTTTSLRFCNVDVLQGVHDVGGAGEHHVLTPKWTTARKVVPHFDGLRGSYSYKEQRQYDENFKFFYKEGDDGIEELYPTSKGWSAVYNATPDKDSLFNGFTLIDYGKVPVYDVIVRPTYTSVENVMYDEENYSNPTKRQQLAALKNMIDFELELANGLRYSHKFNFDLNANYQTVIYLRISRERMDYNESGAEVWEEKKLSDGWYGVNNENGNTLSKAGSSWQRAYTYLNAFFDENGYWTDTDGTVYPSGVTDGQFYNADRNDRDNAQYYTTTYASQFVEKLLQAYQGGPHHGDYFVLQQNISIDARQIPKDFVFTGHLDAQDKTISLTNVDEAVYKAAVNIEDQLYTKAGETYTEWSIPELHVKHVTPATYWQESELTNVDGVWYVTETLTWIEEESIYYTQEECDEENNKLEHHPYRLVPDENGVEPGEEGYIETREYDMEHYVDGYEPLTTDTVKEVIPAHWDTSAGVQHDPGDEKTPEIITYPLATDTTVPTYPTTIEQLQTAEYYTDDQGTPFDCPDLYQYSHNSPASLFSGLNGTYSTSQEQAPNPYLSGVRWEANVHRENGKWVPTLGYRAEVLNARMAEGFTLFKAEASPYTGNVQNCYNGSNHIPDQTPDIPRYK